MRLLVVEDDPHIAGFLQKGLRAGGYSVDRAADGEEALALALNERYDAAVVDLGLPRLDGLSLIEEMRRRGVGTPVLILSARRSVDDRVNGLRSGGDDYLVKPFAFAELLARVQALLRRGGPSHATTRITAGPITIDLLAREASRAGQAIELQPREFALLEFLARNAGRVVSRNEVLGHVWDFDFDPQTNVVEVLVHRLRAKVDVGFEPALIKTIRGMGYVLKIP